MFIEAQGYAIKNNFIFQYKNIIIRMAKNGRYYCTGNSRHIHIRNCFVQDRVDKGEM